jgi:hypothetical protein
VTGTLKLEDDGSLVYTPTLDFNGVITFTYHANDGLTDSNTAVVTITVTAENDGPLAAADGYTTKEDEPLNVAADGVLANDSDVEDDPLTAVWQSGPMSGTLSLQLNGSFVYTPTAGFSGVDTFSYRADDGLAQSDVATVTLTVVARPSSLIHIPIIIKL